jgi:hypothetical protein
MTTNPRINKDIRRVVSHRLMKAEDAVSQLRSVMAWTRGSHPTMEALYEQAIALEAALETALASEYRELLDNQPA